MRLDWNLCFVELPARQWSIDSTRDAMAQLDAKREVKRVSRELAKGEQGRLHYRQECIDSSRATLEGLLTDVRRELSEVRHQRGRKHSKV